MTSRSPKSRQRRATRNRRWPHAPRCGRILPDSTSCKYAKADVTARNMKAFFWALSCSPSNGASQDLIDSSESRITATAAGEELCHDNTWSPSRYSRLELEV